MPRTEIKRHWLWGSRLVTVYTERDRMLQRLGKKLGLNLMKVGGGVTKVLVDGQSGEITELIFRVERETGLPVFFKIKNKSPELTYFNWSFDGGNTWEGKSIFISKKMGIEGEEFVLNDLIRWATK